MTASQFAEVASASAEGARCLDTITVRGAGVARFALRGISSHDAGHGIDTILVNDDNSGTPVAVLRLRDLGDGESMVGIRQVDHGLEQLANLLPRILSATSQVTPADRLRLDPEITDVPLDILAPNFVPDPSDPTHTSYAYPPTLKQAA